MRLFPRPSSTLVPIKKLQRERLQVGHSPRQLLAHLCSSFGNSQFLTIQLTDSTFTVGGYVFTDRGLKLPPIWLCAQFMHLECLDPSLLNECVHLLSFGCVCVPSSRCTVFFQIVIQFSLSSSCACLASSLRLDDRQFTCSSEKK